jgi:hypothetical protein
MIKLNFAPPEPTTAPPVTKPGTEPTTKPGTDPGTKPGNDPWDVPSPSVNPTPKA